MGLVQEVTLKVHRGEEIEESIIALGDKMPLYARQMSTAMQSLSELQSKPINSGYLACYVEDDNEKNTVKYCIANEETGEKMEIADTNHSILKADLTTIPNKGRVDKYVNAYHTMLRNSLGFVNYLNELGYEPKKFCVHVVKKKCTCIEIFM